MVLATPPAWPTEISDGLADIQSGFERLALRDGSLDPDEEALRLQFVALQGRCSAIRELLLDLCYGLRTGHEPSAWRERQLRDAASLEGGRASTQYRSLTRV